MLSLKERTYELLGLCCCQEEKLEPVKNATDDPRIRLLNRLYARKRKELQEKKCTKVGNCTDEDLYICIYIDI